MKHDEDDILKALDESREPPPPDFVDRVMAALPARPSPTWRHHLVALWPQQGRWFVPATAGALATLLVVFALAATVRRFRPDTTVTVTLELDAPDAEHVELVGTFNNWRKGEIRLTRPRADGPWRVTLSLPPGRYEYGFLVDGQRWMTDPRAVAYRADGFGNRNALLDI